MFSIPEEYLYPTTQWHDIGDGISWKPYKHWGTNVWAGEGLEIHNGDRSGCIHKIGNMKWTNAPCVVEARFYKQGEKGISAVFSFPSGIGAEAEYFWEIWPSLPNDIERFMGENAEAEMETRIKKLFAEEMQS